MLSRSFNERFRKGKNVRRNYIGCNDTVGHASRLSLTLKSNHLSGVERNERIAPLSGWILRRWRQARRLSYAMFFAARILNLT